MGEPEIFVDNFLRKSVGHFEYVGISPSIFIEKSDDGIYDIISAFDPRGEVPKEKDKLQWPYP